MLFTQVLWGEEKIIHRVVRTLKGGSTSGSDSDSDSDSEDKVNIRRNSVSSRKVNLFCHMLNLNTNQNMQVANNLQPQNVVYKTRKSVYWITHNNEEHAHTSVFFYTARKSAVKQLSSLLAKTTTNLAICLQSLNFSLVGYSHVFKYLISLFFRLMKERNLDS